MDVSVLTMNKLFGANIRFLIPTFQRPYVWNKDEQWEPLWDDVRNTAENYMEHDGPDEDLRSHFLGAVVVQQQRKKVGDIDRRLVIDGQQRLTTVQLLLDAVQEVMEQRCHTGISKRLSLLVLNNEAFVNDKDEFFKVWPTLSDCDAFRHAMHNGLPIDEFENSRIVQAHQFFKLQVEHWLDERPEETDARAAALESTVTYLLQLVVIDLGINDEPHIIFETLNARGTPLLQSDLIKNMVLYKAGIEESESNSNETLRLWNFLGDWWRAEIGQGGNRNPRIDVFLNYWLTMRTRREVRADRTSTEFRNHVEKIKGPIEDIAADIRQVSQTYRSLEEGEITGFETFLYRREVMQVGTLTPVLLWLFSSEMPVEQTKRAVLALESYLVRRMICRMTTRSYYQLFLGMLSKLEGAGTACAGDAVVKYLSEQTAYASQWPDDRDLENAFLTVPLYHSLTRARLRLVLEGLEERIRSDMVESYVVPRGLTIEHIMPQKWDYRWPLPSRERNVEKAMELRDNRNRIIHTIGNLTLVSGKLNPKLSNSSWTRKRKELNKHAVLFLNKELVDEAPSAWNEDTIAERAKRLSSVAAQIWPSADKMNAQ